MIKKLKLAELNTDVASVFLNTQIEYHCLYCNELSKKIDENLKKRFFNTYRFSNHDITKFILLFRKDVYPYEYIDWKKFNETLLLEIDFYSHLNMEDITDVDYTHAKRSLYRIDYIEKE